MRRLRQDVDWLVSAGLLLTAAATAVTGVIADLWDLNDFWYAVVQDVEGIDPGLYHYAIPEHARPTIRPGGGSRR